MNLANLLYGEPAVVEVQIYLDMKSSLLFALAIFLGLLLALVVYGYIFS